MTSQVHEINVVNLKMSMQQPYILLSSHEL